ncbi:hypothetical protein L596_030827 [Steinernema carpocapsae]|uniref:Uncharacterized protein n=1 Tax=Steinernema carpocapsae TaxID=34508 RepID=A0A4U5LNB6_STECR|nr:hypothetical protein L596_030827 [Steinernema carpocapsae]
MTCSLLRELELQCGVRKHHFWNGAASHESADDLQEGFCRHVEDCLKINSPHHHAVCPNCKRTRVDQSAPLVRSATSHAFFWERRERRHVEKNLFETSAEVTGLDGSFNESSSSADPYVLSDFSQDPGVSGVLTLSVALTGDQQRQGICFAEVDWLKSCLW